MEILELQTFDFSLHARFNVLPGPKCASIFMKIDTFNK